MTDYRFDDFDTTITCEEAYDEDWNEGFTDEEWEALMAEEVCNDTKNFFK